MRIVLFSVFISIHLLGFTQKYPFWENHDLVQNPTPSIHQEPDHLFFYPKFLTAVEYEYDNNYGQFYKYFTEHYRVKLQTHAAIERFNKIYISLEDAVAVKDVKARIIKADSSVIDLDIEMEEFFSEDADNQYQYFPVSGLVLGDELEILYTVKMEPEFNGDQFYFQADIPIYDNDFYFIAPVDSKFEFKAHNDFPEPMKIDTILHRNQWFCHMDTLPALEDEYFDEYTNNRMKVDVALTAVIDGTEEDYSPFQQFADLLNLFYNVNKTTKEQSLVHKLNEKIGVHNSRNTKKRIRLIEDYIKSNIDMNSPGASDNLLDFVKTEKGGVIDAMQLYMALFDDAQIAYEHGFVTNRYDTHFEPDIESQYFMQNNFFYFPDVKEYMAPIDFSSRLGYLNPEWAPNHAFYAKYVSYPKSVDFSVRPIPGTKGKDNSDSTIVNIKILPNMEDMDISVERYVQGYDVGKDQIYYDIYRQQKQREIEQDLLSFLRDRSTYKLEKMENMNSESAFTKPVYVKGNLVDLRTTLIEKGDDVAIFNLGKVIGEYVRTKEIEKKNFDFIFGSESISSRTIKIELPDGVSFQNPTSIPTTSDISPNDSIFISSNYSISGNTLTYEIKERWFSTRFSIDEKPDFINIFEFYAQLPKIRLILE